MAAGAIFIVLAFSPKALAVVLAIPNPVAAAYVTVLLAMLFVLGMKIVVQDGLDYRKGHDRRACPSGPASASRTA